MSDASATRRRVLDAALRTVRRDGIVGASAHAIAAEAEVDEARVLDLFGSVDGLLAEASRRLSAERSEVFAARLAEAESMAHLADIARELHHEELASGRVAVLGQFLAAAPARPEIAAAVRENLELHARPVAKALRRLLEGTALAEAVPPDQLARSVAAGFIGLELLDDLGGEHDPELFGVLDGLAALADVAREGGTMEQRWLERRLRQARAEG